MRDAETKTMCESIHRLIDRSALAADTYTCTHARISRTLAGLEQHAEDAEARLHVRLLPAVGLYVAVLGRVLFGSSATNKQQATQHNMTPIHTRINPHNQIKNHAPLRLGRVEFQGEQPRAGHVQPVDVLFGARVCGLCVCYGRSGPSSTLGNTLGCFRGSSIIFYYARSRRHGRFALGVLYIQTHQSIHPRALMSSAFCPSCPKMASTCFGVLNLIVSVTREREIACVQVRRIPFRLAPLGKKSIDIMKIVLFVRTDDTPPCIQNRAMQSVHTLALVQR